MTIKIRGNVIRAETGSVGVRKWKFTGAGHE